MSVTSFRSQNNESEVHERLYMDHKDRISKQFEVQNSRSEAEEKLL